MLRFDRVGMRFGGLQVLQDVSLDVPAAGIHGLIGPNGAGKTTLFNLATGLLRPSSGTVSFGGVDLGGTAPHAIAGLGIARTFQNIRLFPDMSVLDNVVAAMHAQCDYGALAALLALPSWRTAERAAREQAYELLSSMRLGAKAHLNADGLSYGEQRRLELARALAARPKLLLLDEPVAGMNPAEKDELMAEIVRLGERGQAILMIEHDMRFVMGLCERVAVLNFGRVIADGTPDEVRAHPAVIEAYLGAEDA